MGTDITMLVGAMILGPLTAWVMKKLDKASEGRGKPVKFVVGVAGLNNEHLAILSSIARVSLARSRLPGWKTPTPSMKFWTSLERSTHSEEC
ncbi:hypothetical protein AOC05_15045 [Arthrobacter alpinus]|uniref:Uncharacterized protein n=1 Tax=Arthrobacter alpinus TaxID=656366 RepID=A0A0M5M3M1_9MICC|nr:hypothetical protein AOC05_15045 [Arthrobacter alpinus]